MHPFNTTASREISSPCLKSLGSSGMSQLPRCFAMEIVISAVAGEVVSRFISFLANKYNSSRLPSEEKVQRLQHLLTRVCTIVEEADTRYIPNSGMQMQLQMLSRAMYRGHRVLDSFRCQTLKGSEVTDIISDPSSLPVVVPLTKRSRTVAHSGNDKVLHLEFNDTLENLETVVANMAEFVLLLGGCERMSRRPYDTYLYIDNFMFGRHAEKQRLLSFLLQHSPPGAPPVLPIIGGRAVGKKSLVAHVCGYERVRSHFSSILHLTGDSLLSIIDLDHALSAGITLVIVEFVSDVDDEDWKKFCSFSSKMNRGSKVIIISTIQSVARFGSVKPIFLNILSLDEFLYLFKTLTFGSTDLAEHIQLVQIAEEFSKELRSRGSLIIANALADVLRKNLDVQFWLSILNRTRRMIEKNLSTFGVLPGLLFQTGQPVDITDFALGSGSPIRIIPCTKANDPVKKEIPKVTLGELLVDPTARPTGEFNLVPWQSRIPPFTTITYFVPNSHDTAKHTTLRGKKKRGEMPL